MGRYCPLFHASRLFFYMQRQQRFFCKEKLDIRTIVLLMRRIILIFIGTLWCGMGNQAASENDLGRLADVDSCCRDHDHCDRKVDGFSKEYGYRNWRPFTVSDCDCDKKFYKCLKNAKENPTEATIVGKLFFNILSMPCLRFNTFGTTARKGHSPSYK